MMKKRSKLPSTSLEVRNMARQPMPQPTLRFKDKKKAARKTACRER